MFDTTLMRGYHVKKEKKSAVIMSECIGAGGAASPVESD
jgi:hypothetical protein